MHMRGGRRIISLPPFASDLPLLDTDRSGFGLAIEYVIKHAFQTFCTQRLSLSAWLLKIEPHQYPAGITYLLCCHAPCIMVAAALGSFFLGCSAVKRSCCRLVIGLFRIHSSLSLDGKWNRISSFLALSSVVRDPPWWHCRKYPTKWNRLEPMPLRRKFLVGWLNTCIVAFALDVKA